MKFLRWLFAFLFKEQLRRLEKLERAIALIKNDKCTVKSAKTVVEWMEDPVNHLFSDSALMLLENMLQPQAVEDNFKQFVHDTLQNIDRRQGELNTAFNRLTHRPSPPGFPELALPSLSLADLMQQLEIVSRFRGVQHQRLPWEDSEPASAPGLGWKGIRHVPPNMKSFGHTHVVDYTLLLQRIEQMERRYLSDLQIQTQGMKELRQYVNDMEGELRETIEQVATGTFVPKIGTEDQLIYVVWNEDKSEGYATTDQQLAYEVRKSADSNCYTENGEPAQLARNFCELYGEGDCTIQSVTVPVPK